MPKGILLDRRLTGFPLCRASVSLVQPVAPKTHEPYSHEPRHHNRSCDYINICSTLARREHWYTQLGQPAPPPHHPKHVICNLLNSWESWLEVQAGVERS